MPPRHWIVWNFELYFKIVKIKYMYVNFDNFHLYVHQSVVGG